MQKVEINGEQVEVYTAAEVVERETAAKAAVEGPLKTQLTAAEAEKSRLEGLLEVRSGEIKGIRKLSDDAVSKLTAAELTIYENGLAIAEANKKTEEANKAVHEAAVVSAIRAKVGTDEKLFTETKKMYDMLGLNDGTSEGITARAAAALGALGGTQPDLLAAAGMGGGNYAPPAEKKSEASFADSEAGRAGAAELGLMVEAPKK